MWGEILVVSLLHKYMMIAKANCSKFIYSVFFVLALDVRDKSDFSK